MPEVMEVTQINLNHCNIAQQLLWQATRETKCDVAIIAEPYRVPPDNVKWVVDSAGMAAIQVMGKFPIEEVVSNSNEGFVIVKINGIFVCSCYAPPRWSLEQFHHMLDMFTEELVGRKPVVIGGDFNAWAIEWGSRRTNARGCSLLEALAKLDVTLSNEGTVSTYRKDGRESIIDVTFCSPSLMRDMNWRVCEGYTHSDHQAIRFSIGQEHHAKTRRLRTRERKWKTKAFNKDLFVEALRPDSETWNPSADELTDALVRACDITMPRKVEPSNRRRPAYWWNEQISTLRADCLRARRHFQRAKSAAEREVRRVVFRIARSALKREITLSKSNCYKELCCKAESSPWGDAFRIVMAKTKGPVTTTELCSEKLRIIVAGLFPYHGPTTWPATQYTDVEEEIGEDILVSREELQAVAKGLKTKKAPGPDGIPNVALKAAIQAFPDIFRTVIQKCLNEGCFPDRWKIQKLVLLPKPGKPPGDPTSYRPICLLDTLGKLLEKIMLNRLLKSTESDHGLSNMQFGFRKGKSTVDAIRTVVEKAERASKQKIRGNRHCAVVTIDVKNAFNSASWEAITKSLYKMKVPDYLCRILKSYFENRVLVYETAEGQRSLEITAGVPQGSILGPTLWNAMYNGVLNLKLPKGVVIVGFADDIVLSITGETLEEVEMLATEAITMIENWMQQARLQIAHHKTEVLLVSNCRMVQHAEITVGEHVIASKRTLKYLGVMIDDRLNFNSHVDYACEKAVKAINAVTRIMPNSYGPSSSKRRLLACVSSSIMRYGGPAWIAALKTKRNQAKLNSMFRLMAMRVASAYRTISMEAVCVIAGMVPISITLVEDSECYRRKEIRGVRKLARAESMAKWQQEWDTAPNGRWTHRLIPRISNWVNRKHGEVNFYLTQFLSGHGCFRQYLHRFGHARSPVCPQCREDEETAEHVVFVCPRFSAIREGLPFLNTENIVEEMCRNEATWNAASNAIRQIMLELQRKWREDQRLNRE
jgi:hypothetical protein